MFCANSKVLRPISIASTPLKLSAAIAAASSLQRSQSIVSPGPAR